MTSPLDGITAEHLGHIRANLAKSGTPNEVHGHCFAVSEAIVAYLRGHGYAARVVEGRMKPETDQTTWADAHRRSLQLECRDGCLHHFWVEVPGWIIDGTAAQFGESPLLVIAADDSRHAWYQPHPL